MTLLDTNTVEGAALTLMARSATGLFAVTIVVTELLPGSKSVTSPVTLATLLFDPALVGVTMMVTVALPPLRMVPKFTVTTPALLLNVPWLGFAETKLVPAGSTFVSTTAVALLGPLFATVRV